MSYKFKTELHCHTKSVSHCAHDEPEHLVETYLAAGYTTIVVTDHLSDFTFKYMSQIGRDEGEYRYLPADFDRTIFDRSDAGEATWDDKISFLMAGPAFLRKVADGRLTVLLGAELRLPDSANDYLLYGVTEEFLRANPDLNKCSVKQASLTCRASGVLMIQAHPFRNRMKIVEPDYLDGIEIYNGAHNHDSRNDFAEMWARRYNMIVTSGSDYHDDYHSPDAGILTEAPIRTSEELLSVLRSGNYELIRE